MGPGRLKAAATAGTLAACGASALVVATDPKPAAAPLHPPVAAATVSSSSSAPVAPPSCATQNAGRAQPQLAPELQQAYAAWRRAASIADRNAVLAPLSPDLRQQVIAHARQRQRRAGAATCGSGVQTPATGVISPSISDAPPSAPPDVSSYVS